MSVETYTGSCHCGAIRFEADLDLDEGSNRCNCSYCAKARTWFAFAKGRASAFACSTAPACPSTAGRRPVTSEPHLTFTFCRTCGVRTYARGNLDVARRHVPRHLRARARSLARTVRGDPGPLHQRPRPPLRRNARGPTHHLSHTHSSVPIVIGRAVLLPIHPASGKRTSAACSVGSKRRYRIPSLVVAGLSARIRSPAHAHSLTSGHADLGGSCRSSTPHAANQNTTTSSLVMELAEARTR